MKLGFAIALALMAALAGAGLAVLDVGLRGYVNVPPGGSPIAFNIDLVINEREGVAVYDLGRVVVPDGSVIAKVALLSREGNFSVVVNGVLTLKSEERAYVIDMPCMIAINAPCFKVMAIIPGWNKPMPIEGGTYHASLKLTWIEASGSGKFHAKLQLIHLHRAHEDRIGETPS